MRLPLFIALLTTASIANAGLIKGDFLTTGDGLLITDTATSLEWLSPLATRYQTYGNATIQNIESAYGFHYATYSQTTAMLTANFGSVSATAPGDAAGFTAANSFFSIFGVAENTTCGDGSPCPRTQGLTSDPGSFANTHLGAGMITLGSTGWMITNNPWPDNFGDTQMGSWLVRDASSSAETPEPASVGLALAGTGMLLLLRRR